jgi:hypothetical protein
MVRSDTPNSLAASWVVQTSCSDMAAALVLNGCDRSLDGDGIALLSNLSDCQISDNHH